MMKQTKIWALALLFSLGMTACGDDEEVYGSTPVPESPKPNPKPNPKPQPDPQPEDKNGEVPADVKFVDMGDHLLWADRNIGAASVTDGGDYFAWGEIRTKADYSKDTYRSPEPFMQYIARNPKYDAALASWGEQVSMPDIYDFETLALNSTMTEEVRNGVKGMTFKSRKNGQELFFPYAGQMIGTTLEDRGMFGLYLSGGTPDEDGDGVQTFIIANGDYSLAPMPAWYGYSIRAVKEQ